MAVVKVKPRCRYLFTTSRMLPPINHLSLLPKNPPFLNTSTLLLSLRERETDRQRQRQTKSERNRDRQTVTDRDRDRVTERDK